MRLPLQQTDQEDLSLLQTKWKAIIDPVITLPLNSSLMIPSIRLTSGDNTINHRLGRKIQGWIVIGNDGNTIIYDKQDANSQTDLTLVLNVSVGCVISLLVF